MREDISIKLSFLRKLWKRAAHNRGGQREYFRLMVMTMRMVNWRARAYRAENELRKLMKQAR